MLQTLPNQRAWTKGSAATLAKKVSKPRGGGVRSKLDNRSWWLGDVGERPEFSSGNVVSDKFVMENPTNSQSFNGDILWIYMCGFVVRYVHVQLLLTSVDYMYQYLVSMSPNQFCSNFCFFLHSLHPVIQHLLMDLCIFSPIYRFINLFTFLCFVYLIYLIYIHPSIARSVQSKPSQSNLNQSNPI